VAVAGVFQAVNEAEGEKATLIGMHDHLLAEGVREGRLYFQPEHRVPVITLGLFAGDVPTTHQRRYRIIEPGGAVLDNEFEAESMEGLVMRMTPIDRFSVTRSGLYVFEVGLDRRLISRIPYRIHLPADIAQA
jgi:hypothetical protein